MTEQINFMNFYEIIGSRAAYNVGAQDHLQAARDTGAWPKGQEEKRRKRKTKLRKRDLQQ